MAIRHFGLAAVSALGGLVACASIAGLDSSDPTDVPSSSSGTSGPSTSSGNVATDGGITTEAGVSFSASSVDFQPVGCGHDQSQTITISNDSATAQSVNVSLPADAPFAITNAQAGQLHLDIAAHGKGSFEITTKGAKAGANAADVVVKVGEEEHHIAVTLTLQGGALTLDPPTVDFGKIKINTKSAKQTVTLRNQGNAEITVNGFGASTNFKVDPASGFKVAPGATYQVDVDLEPGGTSNGTTISESLKPSVEGLCGDTPSLLAKGEPIDAPFTVNPSTVQFGDQPCGAKPTAQKITVTNYLDNAATFSIGSGASVYTLTSDVSGNGIPAAVGSTPGTATITVALANAGQSPVDVSETVPITVTSGVSSTTTPITLLTHVKGALLAVDRTAISLNRSTQSSGQTHVTLTNNGNVSACIQYTRTNDVFMSEDVQCNQYFCTEDNEDSVTAQRSTQWDVRYYKNGSSNSTTTITAKIIGCSNGPFAGRDAPVPLCGNAPAITVTAAN